MGLEPPVIFILTRRCSDLSHQATARTSSSSCSLKSQFRPQHTVSINRNLRMSRGPHGLPKSVRFDQSAGQNGPPAAMPNDPSGYLPSKILSHQVITSDPPGFQQQPLSLMAHDNHQFGTYFTGHPNISGAASMPNPAPPPTFYNLPPHTEIPDNSFLTPYIGQQDVHGQGLRVVGNPPHRQTRVPIVCAAVLEPLHSFLLLLNI